MTNYNQTAFNEQSFTSEEPVYVLNNEQASRAFLELLARVASLEAKVQQLEGGQP